MASHRLVQLQDGTSGTGRQVLPENTATGQGDMGRLSQCRTYGMVPEANNGSHHPIPKLPQTLPQQKEGYGTAFAIPL